MKNMFKGKSYAPTMRAVEAALGKETAQRITEEALAEYLRTKRLDGSLEELSGADYFFMVYAYGHDFYAKLVNEIGSGAFYEGLKTYYNANYMGIGTKEKLIAAFSEAAGRDLTGWFEKNIAPEAAQCGMFLFHNGTVRRTAKAMVRENAEGTAPVSGMYFSYDAEKVDAAIKKARAMPGIYYVRVWLNEGRLELGDDIMLVLVGGDIRPHVIDALQSLVGEIKQHCVVEKEIY